MTTLDLALTAGLAHLPPALTVEQYAEAVNIGRSTAYEQVRRGEVPVVRCGKRGTRIPRWKVAFLLTHDRWPAERETLAAVGQGA